MKSEFDSVLDQIKEFALDVKIALKDELLKLIFTDTHHLSSQIHAHTNTSCPYCHSKRIIKNGFDLFLNQKYICKVCKKYFNDTTGEVIHGIHDKNKWLKHIDLLLNGNFLTIQKMAKELNMNHKTAFRWRHKILTAIQMHVKKFDGMVEMDDLHYNFSQKGRRGMKRVRRRGKDKGFKGAGDNDLSVKVLATMDRKGTCLFNVVKIGRLSANDIVRTGVGEVLDKEVNVLCSDKHPSIHAFSKKIQIEHESFTAKTHVKHKIFHVNTVNEKANRLNHIINHHFKGVATKYLHHYTNWFKLVELTKSKSVDFIERTFRSHTAWFEYHQIELNYKIFLERFSNIEYDYSTKWS